MLKKLAKILKDIQKEVNPQKVTPEKAQQDKVDLRNKFNDLVRDFNELKSEKVAPKKTRLERLEENNVLEVTSRMGEVRRELIPGVAEEYNKSKEDYGTGAEFDELAMVMSLVHMKEFWGKKPDETEQHPEGANWTHFEKRMGGKEVPENGKEVPARVKEVNNALLERVGNIHADLVKERQLKMEELENDPELAKNKKNIEMRANNLLYEEYLQKVHEKRLEVRGLGPNASKEIKLELQELQSKALFFANEAYMTAIGAEQVVLNQQLDLDLELPTAQYLASIIEQTTFVGEQIAHVTGNNKHGRALWKTSKYVNRIVDAIETIFEQTDELAKKAKTGEAVPSEDIMTKVRDLKPLGEKLEAIKRDSDLTEDEDKRSDEKKDEDAKTLAGNVTKGLNGENKANSDVLGTDITGLATNILNLVSDVTLNVQDYLVSQETKNQ